MIRIIARKLLWGGMLTLWLAGQGNAQRVPEGVHQDARGPAEMCGLVGRDARELIEKARLAPSLRATPVDSARFEVFASADGLDLLVVTRPTEPAHPTATCRHVYRDAAGNWLQERNMRCDAGRDACDRLFLEFQALDARMRQAIADER